MSQRSALLLLFLFFILSTSAPIHPPHETTGWRGQPPGRGTFQIILSCIVTLGLCVWTSVHPDMNGGMEPFDRLLHKIGLALMALLMPEMIISEAWGQWREARALHRALVYESWKKRRVQAGSKPVKAQWWHPVKNKFITLLTPMGAWVDDDAFPKEVAFFVIMGGYVDSNNNTVTAPDFFRAFKENRIAPIPMKPSPVASPDGNATTVPPIYININDVLDKSKSSALAKLIVCGQVGWMVLQMLGRGVSGLPITLIELHTLIHILIAVIRFWLWWYKPLDVFETIMLDTTFEKETTREWNKRPEEFESEKWIRNFIEHMWLLPPIRRNDNVQSQGAPPSRTETNSPETRNGNANNADTLPAQETAIVTSPGAEGKPQDFREIAEVQTPQDSEKMAPAQALQDSENGVGIWGKVRQFSDKYSLVKTTPTNLEIWGNNILRDNSFACIFYFAHAALHAAAWSTYFSTRAEQWFWRGSCLVVGIVPLLAVLIAFMVKSFESKKQLTDINEAIERIRRLRDTREIEYILEISEILANRETGYKPREHNRQDRKIIRGIKDRQTLLAMIFFITYLLGSMGLLIESFVSLRRRPIEVYESVRWTAYIPHF